MGDVGSIHPQGSMQLGRAGEPQAAGEREPGLHLSICSGAESLTGQ